MENTLRLKTWMIEYIGIDEDQRSKLIQLELYSKPVLEYIHIGIPNFPNHGFFHVVNVIDNINRLLEMYEQLGVNFRQKERFVLYVSAWIHDWGNIKVQQPKDRKNHSIYSAQIIEELKEYFEFLNEDIVECIKRVVAYHSKSSGINIHELPKEFSNVRLRLVSALFRLADASDLSFSRASKILFKILEDQLTGENRQYWEAHRSILNIQFSDTKIILEVSSQEKAKNL